MDDRFGLGREQSILQSGVRDVFTPHQPVRDKDMLFGRDQEVRRLIEYMNTPGQHALLYGERGVGKSSLANITVDVHLSRLAGGKVFKKRCDSTDTFQSIVASPLEAVGVRIDVAEITEHDAKRRGFKADVKVLGGNRERESGFSVRYERAAQLSPGKVAEDLNDLAGLLVIDEADAIRSDSDKEKLAEFVKHLSDNGARLKVLIVGIAETGAELTAAHPSVSRCLRETKLARMSGAELRDIVTVGAARVGLQFNPNAVNAIVSCSAGYPHFTHLLALKSAEAAISVSRREVTKDDVIEAMGAAISDAEGSLKTAYDDATRSHGTDMYRIVLVAAASLGKDEFSAEELRSAIERASGEKISQGSLNNYFQRLVALDTTRILRRVAKGVYRFSDPRMPSYVRIANRMV